MNVEELAIYVGEDSGGTRDDISTQELAIQDWENEGGAIGRIERD